MSFDNYSGLQEEVIAKLNRSQDGEAVLRCASWITLAEDAIRIRLRKMKSRQGETRDSVFSIAAEYTALPSGFIRFRSPPALQTNPVAPLEYVTPAQADNWDMTNSSGQPKRYTVEGNQLRVDPAPSTTYTAKVTYYTLPSLTLTSPTNWLLTAHPRLYFKAVLAEAYDFYDDAENYDKTMVEVSAMMDEIDATDGADNQGSRMRVKVSGATP